MTQATNVPDLYREICSHTFNFGSTVVEFMLEEWTGAPTVQFLGVSIYAAPNWENVPGLTVQVTDAFGRTWFVEGTIERIETIEEYETALADVWPRVLQLVAGGVFLRKAS